MRVCFLIQTPSEFPNMYKEYNLHDFGDVYLLTFKKQCPKISKYYKYSYFYPESRFSNGRDFLIVESLKYDYDYYISMDDDAKMISVCDENPIITFLNFLKKYQPAIGVTKFNGQFNGELEVNNVGSCMDHLVLAVHKEAIHNLFPYHYKFDKESWYYSNVIWNYISSLLYNSYKLQCNNVITENVSWNYPPTNYTERKAKWKKPFQYTLDQLKDEYKPILSAIKPFETIPYKTEIKFKDIDYRSVKISDIFQENSKILRHHTNFWNNINIC